MIKLALLVAGVALVAAGCGGGKAPGVASLAPSHGDTTTTNAAPAVAASGPSGAPSGGQPHVAMKVPAGSDGERFSVCMRSHGLPTFPDPNGQGVIQFGAGIDPGSPKFQAAQSACRKLLPNGGVPSPAQIAKAQKAALEFSACMRKNGIKDFPDPTFRGGGVQLSVGGRPGSDLNPNSPLFQKARAACSGFMAAKGPPGGNQGGK